jgi:hypothetical protein
LNTLSEKTALLAPMMPAARTAISVPILFILVCERSASGAAR